MSLPPQAPDEFPLQSLMSSWLLWLLASHTSQASDFKNDLEEFSSHWSFVTKPALDLRQGAPARCSWRCQAVPPVLRVLEGLRGGTALGVSWHYQDPLDRHLSAQPPGLSVQARNQSPIPGGDQARAAVSGPRRQLHRQQYAPSTPAQAPGTVCARTSSWLCGLPCSFWW